MDKWVDCEYPGYREQVPSLRTKLKQRIEPLFQPRYLTISALFFPALLQFGATAPKAAAVSIAAYFLMVLPLGTRYIERLALLAFAVALVGWIDIIPASIADSIQSRVYGLAFACR